MKNGTNESNEMAEAMDELYGVYCNLYNEQLAGAVPEYEEWFRPEFAPPDKPWADAGEAASAMGSLISELYEDCDNVEEMLEDAGLTDGLARLFGLEL